MAGPETLRTQTLTPQLAPLDIAGEFASLSHETAYRLQPTYEAITAVQNWVSAKLHAEFDNTIDQLLPQPHSPESAGKPDIETLLNAYLDGKIALSPRLEMTPVGERLKVVAAQYEHVRQVNETTFLLKKWLVEHDLPKRTVAYQLGTGFPLPAENKKCVKKGFLPYEDEEKEGGVLRHCKRPGEAGHAEDAGIYVYEITNDNGQAATLLALKGREHGYAKTGNPQARLDLARMGRVLKGIGTEILLSGYATGVDVINISADKFQVGDYAIALYTDDLSGLRAVQDPGSGDQTLVGSLYGGPFGADANRSPHPAWYKRFIAAVKNAQPPNTGSDRPPRVHPALAIDAISIPHFEGPAAAVLAKLITDAVLNHNILPIAKLAEEFGVSPKDLVTLATVQGMNITTELSGYFRMQPESWGGHPSVFNRTLPTLAVAGFTDTIDPSPEGESRLISHQRVLKAGKRSAEFIAPVITYFFTDLIAQPWKEMALAQEDGIADEILAGLPDRPFTIDHVQDYLERHIRIAEARTQLYRGWGINDIADKDEKGALELGRILDSLADNNSRFDYDYFINLRNAWIQMSITTIGSYNPKSIFPQDKYDLLTRYRNNAHWSEFAARCIAYKKSGLIIHEPFQVDNAIYHPTEEKKQV